MQKSSQIVAIILSSLTVVAIQVYNYQGVHHIYYYFFKDLVRYPHIREGVSAPGGWVWLAHAMARLIIIVGLWPYGQHFCITKRCYECHL